jgi:hypothetical protein
VDANIKGAIIESKIRMQKACHKMTCLSENVDNHENNKQAIIIEHVLYI